MGLWVLLVIGLVYLWSRIRRLEKTVRTLEQRLSASSVEDAPSEQGWPPAEQLESSEPAAHRGWQSEATATVASDTVQQPVEPESVDQEPEPEAADTPWRTAQPRPSRDKPSFLDIAFNRVKRYFTEGNLIVRVGVIVLFFGVAFLLRYANAHMGPDLVVR